MLKFSLDVTRMDRIRNEYIRGTDRVKCFGGNTGLDGLNMCRGEREAIFGNRCKIWS